jgi:uncharacterized membrane protein YraQ (UPF0718 family)
MDMSAGDGPLLRRAFTATTFTAVSHIFFMNVYGVWLDLLLGFLIAGALGAWVPETVWSALFLSGHGALSDVWGVCLGPVIAMLTFVCSVGNVPLAAVLWRVGIGFGGVISFIFGDLIIIPILDIYRRYYGGRTATYLFAVSFVAMVVAGLLINVLFHLLGVVPTNRTVAAIGASISWGWNTWLDLVSLALAAALGVRFVRTGGMAMLRMMA